MRLERYRGRQAGRWEILTCWLSGLLACFAPGSLPAATTNAVPVQAILLLLPSDYAGQSYPGMTFQPTNAGRMLLLYPCTNCGGSGTTILSSVTVTGIVVLNGLTDTNQSFAVGTAGADFAISSAGSTHTFNLPTASASVRGALSSADWTTFNAKQGPIVFNTDQFAASATQTNIKSGALQTNGNFKSDQSGTLALTVQTNVFLVTNHQVAIRVPPDANGYLTVEGASANGIIVKHATGSPRMLVGTTELGTKTDTTVNFIVGASTRWNIGDSTLSYALYPEASNTTDFARATLPARIVYAKVWIGSTASNLLALNYDRAQMFVPTNNSLSNITVNLGTTNYVEIWTTNNLTFTNWVGITDGGVGNYTAIIRPQLITRGVNWGNLGLSNPGYGVAIATNANNAMWTSLTNDKTYALTITRVGTNLFPTLTVWL